MKSRLLFLMLIISTIFTACSKDDDVVNTKLITTELSLKSGQTSQIVIEPNGEGCTFTSDNNLIASVKTTGEVKGVIIGETSINISNPETGFNGKCKVLVTPQYQMYKEPYLKFGATKQDVKSFESRTLLREETNSLSYNGENSNIDGVAYLFENGKLKSVGCRIPYSKTSLLGDFLAERYTLIAMDGYEFYCISVDKKIVVGVVVESSYIAVVYMDGDKILNKSKSAISFEQSKEFERLFELLNLKTV